MSIPGTGVADTETVRASRASQPGLCPTSEVNFVAHQDDDILFMNPDILDSITMKRCVQTVYVTAGEWNGTSSMSREQYAASRMQGTLAAYASMANVDNSWTRTVSAINGHNIEIATLDAAPNVKLIYLSVRDGRDSISTNNLIDLYKGLKPSVKTIVPTGTPAGIFSTTYTKDDLRSTLQSILVNYSADVVRTQDYMPDARLRSDHEDHVYGALFAVDAARSYAATSATPVNIVTYRDYNILDSPVNVGSKQIAQKNKAIDAYRAYDPVFAVPGTQNDSAGRMYYRWPVAPTWVTKNWDGRLQAFAVLSSGLVTWQQTTNGSWSGMQRLGNSSLQPGIGVGRNHDGTLQVFVVKQITDSQGTVQQDVQYIKQTSPGGAFSTWTSLGSSGPSHSGKYDISSPAAVLNADGRMEIFVKDSNGNLATKYQLTTGQYSGWVNTGGNNALMEAPTAILRTDGRIEVFAASRGTASHWLQRSPNGTIVYDSAFVAAQAVGTPSAGFNQDGRPEIFYRRAGSGQIFTVFQASGETWSTSETSLGGQSSQGAPAVVNGIPVLQPGSRITLLARTPQTGFETLAQRGDNRSFVQPWRTLTTVYSQFAPSALLDDNNAIHYVTLSQDGALVDTTQPLLP